MVTALLGLIPYKYHRLCYAEREKEIAYQIFYQQYPVNFGMGNVVAFLSPLLMVFMGWAGWEISHSYIGVAIFAVLGFWPGLLRLIAYWKWERPLGF